MVIKPDDKRVEFLAMRKSGGLTSKRKCLSTGFQNMDEHAKLAKGYLSIWSGYPGSGKSEYLDAVLLNMSLMHGWKVMYYSPENHPVEEHMTKLAEKFIGKHISEFKEAEEQSSLDFLQKHFTWMYPEDPKLDMLLGLATKEHEQNGIDALVIDPWNAVTHHRGGELIHEYLSEALSKMIRFGRGNNVFIAIVAHPTKPQKDKDGNFPVPTLYDISDGAMWRNKADYGFICHRADMSKNELDVYVQKVKYKWMGKVGMTRFDYNYRNGRFKQPEDKDFSLPTEIVPPF